ncbi:MAG TPA: hypothetical protein PLH72_07325 [Vicinamibacterales bacterium]|nr:hypothetical protein [Vicinamibacterales bacterium]
MASLIRQGRWLVCVVALLAAGVGVDAAELDGTWTFTLSAPEGEHTFTISLTTDGEKVAGKRGDASYTGTFKDGQLKLNGSHYIDEVGQTFDLELTGKLDGDQITGDGSIEGFALTVQGTRADRK